MSIYQSFDLLATLVTVVDRDGRVLFSNAALEDVLGISRRAIVGSSFADAFTEPSQLQNALEGALENEFGAMRYDAWLKRVGFDARRHSAWHQTHSPARLPARFATGWAR